jgi:hypothetical protein
MFILTNSPKEFIPSSQKDKDDPLTFIVIPPKRQTVLGLQEILLSSVGEDAELDMDKIPMSKIMEIYFNDCVIGWKNVVDSNNKPIEFTKENFQLINDIEMLTELYQFIQGLGTSDPLA